MAIYDFKNIETKYDKFHIVSAIVKINDKELPNKKAPYEVSDVDVDLTCGFEASMASFSIYNVYNEPKAQFETTDIQKYIYLGSKVEVFLGYRDTVQSVFVGLIAKVSYQYLDGEIPCIRVTAMDPKSIMMAGSYHKQLKAKTHTDAVKEILQKTTYNKLQSTGIISGIEVTAPMSIPNVGGAKASAETIEMVAESDYEFIVKLAKKYNYEFFCDNGKVYYRKAKAVTTPIFTLSPSMGVQSFDIEYDITGLSETILARSTDAAKGSLIEAKTKFTNKISMGNKAKNMIKGSQHVYVDPTISSDEDAKNRVESLLEDISFRFGTLNLDMVGIPEMKPGYFLDLQCFGDGPSNVFYIMNVRHIIRGDGGYTMHITGKSNSML